MDEDILSKFSYGVYVVTTIDDNNYAGCIANSLMQVTANPIAFAISLHHDNYTNICIKKSKKLAISILSEKTPPSIIGTFGFNSSKDFDKFKETNYSLFNDLPVMNDSCGYVICDVSDIMETNSHTIFKADALSYKLLEDVKEMTYAYYHQVIKGKRPKNAPTYMKD